ncbi:hypothetical protein VSU19_03585 [Verrucomicrobiales bacterium BCK34]|nr:hypothetical protein [Verrucomicrobiales bacterium BCK34]
MIDILTKEQVAKLSPEQQEVIARLALDDARSRRAMLEQAKSYRGYRLAPTLLVIVGSCLWFWNDDMDSLLPFFGLLVLIFIKFHVWGVNSRIDALIRILNLDSSTEGSNNAEQNKDGKAPPAIS